ncbi:hypothetical protein MNB_SM-4-302 [hydrothermal vent metagenome]|uniref:Lipoprotein n=1 Tax=hydrothermal vent metagenome TaxID=652676 RepID=A0A1W1BVD5_9ZZZZ
MKLILVSISLLIGLIGCAPIQDTYKPLYQASPEKQAIEAK